MNTGSTLLLLLGVLGCFTATLPMSKARRLLTSPTAKNIAMVSLTTATTATALGISSGLSLAKTSISIAPLADDLLYAITPSQFIPYSTETETSAPVTEFVKENLKKIGFSPDQLNNLVIKTSCCFSSSQRDEHYIITLDETQYKALDTILTNVNNKSELDQELLARNSGIIQHEGIHLLNGDSKQSTVLCNIITTITLTELLAKMISINRKNNISYFKKNIYKIPQGIAKAYANLLIYSSISRSQEQRADNGIQNNREILLATRNSLISRPSDTSVSHTPWYRNFNSHPSDKTRIDRFNERIKSLEAKECSIV